MKRFAAYKQGLGDLTDAWQVAVEYEMGIGGDSAEEPMGSPILVSK